MGKFTFILLIMCCVSVSAQQTYSIDYEMAIKTIDWLDYINSGADSSAVKDYFMKNVAVTEGCKTIIKHWARFRKWDNEIFYNFVLEALGRKESKNLLTEPDGTPSAFARSRNLWQNALKNSNALKNKIEELKKESLEEKSISIASKFLPKETKFKNVFYIVLFGASNAFSVGDRNGYDLLQFPQKENGSVDLEEALQTFAHELHHTGFSYLNKTYMKDVFIGTKIMLPGILAAEGMPTFYINKPFENINKLKNGNDESKKRLGLEWEKHKLEMKNYYRKAETDIRKLFDGEIKQEEVFDSWMNGLQGPAYALGADMYSVIDKYSGIESSFEAAKDYRLFLKIYNEAAKKGNFKGAGLFIFNEDLVDRITKYTELKK